MAKQRDHSYKQILWLVGAAAVTLILFGLTLTLNILHLPAAGNVLRVNGKSYSLEVVQTPAAEQLGLGYRASMPENHGMLFVFTKPAVECFWMKDMRFPLDMVWMDAGKKVVHIEQNVSPKTYPKTYCPNQPAKYVIELNAGVADQAGIRDNETLNF